MLLKQSEIKEIVCVASMKERYKLLLLSSTILFAFYFAYDIPSALNHHIGLTPKPGIEYKITLLYSVYSLPNIVVPVFFGWITHIRKSTMAQLLCLLVFIGQFVFAFGVWSHNFKIMLLGRFLFGVGGESFAVIQNRLISYEFKGKELAFAMGIFSSIARLGTVSNFLLTPLLADRVGRMAPCSIGVLLTLLGFVICLRINSPKRSHDILKQKLIDIQKNKPVVLEEQSLTGEGVDGMFNSFYPASPSPSPSMNEKSSTSDNPFFHDYEETNNPGGQVQARPINPIIKDNPFSPWKEVKNERTALMKNRLEKAAPKVLFQESGTLFYEPVLEGKNTYHSAFCVLAGISFMFALVWAPFYNVAPMLFQQRYGLNAVSSGNMLAIIEGMSLVLIIFTSTAVDTYGFKLWFVAAGCVFLLLGHLGILVNLMSPYISTVMLGFAGPLIACYWPCIPSLVSEESLGTGFATIYCILNLAFTFSPIAVAFLADGDKSYGNVEAYMLITGSGALVLIMILFYLNEKQSLGLNDKASPGYEHTDI